MFVCFLWVKLLIYVLTGELIAFKILDEIRHTSLVQEKKIFVWHSATPWTKPSRLLCPWNSPGKNTEVGSHSLLQGIFPTQGANPGLLTAGRFFTVKATREAPHRDKTSTITQIMIISAHWAQGQQHCLAWVNGNLLYFGTPNLIVIDEQALVRRRNHSYEVPE